MPHGAMASFQRPCRPEKSRARVSHPLGDLKKTDVHPKYAVANRTRPAISATHDSCCAVRVSCLGPARAKTIAEIILSRRVLECMPSQLWAAKGPSCSAGRDGETVWETLSDKDKPGIKTLHTVLQVNSRCSPIEWMPV